MSAPAAELAGIDLWDRRLNRQARKVLEKLSRLESALAFYMIIAWRVLYLTMLGRKCPELPCNLVFADEEWQAVYIVAKRKPPPQTHPPHSTKWCAW